MKILFLRKYWTNSNEQQAQFSPKNLKCSKFDQHLFRRYLIWRIFTSSSAGGCLHGGYSKFTGGTDCYCWFNLSWDLEISWNFHYKAQVKNPGKSWNFANLSWKILEFNIIKPGKPSNMCWKILENPGKTWNFGLNFRWQPCVIFLRWLVWFLFLFLVQGQAVHSISPTYGSIRGGTIIVITGEGE